MNRRMREIVNAAGVIVAPVIGARSHPDRPLDKVPGLTVRNATSDTAEIMVYGPIGGGGWFDEGITSSDMATALAETSAPKINVRINSGGGDMFEGTAMYTLLARHPAQVTTWIDGLAGSAASVLAMAGDEIRTSDAGVMMIHDASTMTYGNGADHREAADLLDKLSDVIAGVYANRAGDDGPTWRAKMSAPGGNGTWYTAQEMLDAGLADVIERAEDQEAPATAIASALATARLRAPERIEVRVAQHMKIERPPAEVVVAEPQKLPQPVDTAVDNSDEWAWVAAAIRVRGL